MKGTEILVWAVVISVVLAVGTVALVLYNGGFTGTLKAPPAK